MFSIKDLYVHYGKVASLQGVSLKVEPGQIVTLVGANGAGKTTLLRTASGLHRATSGEIWLEGQRINACSPRTVVKMGLAHVPEGRRIFPFMSVLNNLKVGAFTQKDKHGVRQDLETVYSHFPILKERSNQEGGTLSGGEQQMLAIGRALMARPNLLFMDEPSMGLSPILVKEIAKIILEINQMGKSIVLVEQNAALALRLAHWSYVIQTGKIVLEGTGQELLNNKAVKMAYLGGKTS